MAEATINVKITSPHDGSGLTNIGAGFHPNLRASCCPACFACSALIFARLLDSRTSSFGLRLGASPAIGAEARANHRSDRTNANHYWYKAITSSLSETGYTSVYGVTKRVAPSHLSQRRL